MNLKDLIFEYIETANKYGWYHPRLLWFSISHWNDKELRLLISRARSLRSFLKNGGYSYELAKADEQAVMHLSKNEGTK